MATEIINTVVIGGGQAGIAMSEHLSNAKVEHVVLERSRIAERWRSERWDSLVANGPAWHDRFPSMEFDSDPNGFPNKEEVAGYFEAYAKKINAPVRCGVNVTQVQRKPGHGRYHVQTSAGELEANHVVIATGAFQRPIIPPVVPQQATVHQLHSNGYHNPEQLPDGGVLVVGAGSSGAQIADELCRAGRRVYLSVGPHDRPPRAYRGRDFVWWLGVLGKWDAAALAPGTEHVTIAVSGARGGRTVDFRRFAHEGITLVGMTESYADGVMRFADDVVDNVCRGDASYLSLLDEADEYVERCGLELPLEPDARTLPAEPECMTNPVRSLHLSDAGVNSILWATGYRNDYSWLEVDVLNQAGDPQHQRGVTAEPGLYFLGLPWQSRRGSSFIWGVWHDAKYLADQIVIQRSYQAYHNAMQQHIKG